MSWKGDFLIYIKTKATEDVYGGIVVVADIG